MDGIREQLEFWMGDDNLASDAFLRETIAKDAAGYVPLSVFAGFRRFQKTNVTVEDIARAIATASAPSAVIELSPDGTRVRRKLPLPPPVDLAACKVVAYPMSEGVSEAEAKQLFSEYGKVFSVSLLSGTVDNAATTAALVRFVVPDGATKAMREMPGKHGVKAVVAPPVWFAQQRALRKPQRQPAAATEATPMDTSTTDANAAAADEAKPLPPSQQTPKICIVGPVPVNIERKDVMEALRPLAPSGVVIDMRKLKRSKFSDEDPETLKKPLVDIHVRFVQENDARAAIDASAAGTVVIAKRPVKIVPLTESEIRDHYAPTIAEALEKAREWGRHPQRQQRAERRNIAKGEKRRRTQKQQQPPSQRQQSTVVTTAAASGNDGEDDVPMECVEKKRQK